MYPTDPSRKFPNRPLDLQELEDPDFRNVLAALDGLLEQRDGFYLHPSKRWEYPWAMERAGIQQGDRVLDAGCGGSIFPVYLSGQGYETWALDIDFPEEVKSEAPEVGYVRGNLTMLPFPSACFDTVFCISVIEHLHPTGMRQSMAELRRVLKPGGRLLLTTDYYRDANEELWYEGPGERFKVDWNFFDRSLLSEYILRAPGLRVEGETDLAVEWDRVSPEMVAFHGYPYTSVGVALKRADSQR